MKNIEKKNCLQGLKRQNKLLANTSGKKISLHFEKKRLQRCINILKKNFHTPPPGK